MIEYNDELHQYSFKGKVYTSATQLVSKYKEPFDTKARAEAYAAKHGQTAQYWIDQWAEARDKSLVRGNRRHNHEEVSAIRAGTLDIDFREYTVYDPSSMYTKDYFKELADGLYVELPLWNHFYRLAGRADRVLIYTIGTDRYVKIQDHKTNKKIEKQAYQFKSGAFKMLLPPVHHLQECNLVEYTLQLSTYMLMLEMMGFTPDPYKPLQLIHYPHVPLEAPEGAREPDPVYYDLDYLRKEVILMAVHNKKRLS